MEHVEQPQKTSIKAFIKILIFFFFVAAAICLFRITNASDILTPEVLEGFLETLGFWAPFVFIVIFSTGICLFVPTSVLTMLGASIFGAYQGFIYAWIGAMAGSSAAFIIGRTLGRDFVGSNMGATLKRYDNAIARNGFSTVLYLRLLNTPFTYMNFGIGLTKVSFPDYFLGTGIGIIVSIFALSFFGGTLKEVWISGNWENLLTTKFYLSLGIFVFSFFIPIIIKKIKENGRFNNPAASHD